MASLQVGDIVLLIKATGTKKTKFEGRTGTVSSVEKIQHGWVKVEVDGEVMSWRSKENVYLKKVGEANEHQVGEPRGNGLPIARPEQVSMEEKHSFPSGYPNLDNEAFDDDSAAIVDTPISEVKNAPSRGEAKGEDLNAGTDNDVLTGEAKPATTLAPSVSQDLQSIHVDSTTHNSSLLAPIFLSLRNAFCWGSKTTRAEDGTKITITQRCCSSKVEVVKPDMMVPQVQEDSPASFPVATVGVLTPALALETRLARLEKKIPQIRQLKPVYLGDIAQLRNIRRSMKTAEIRTALRREWPQEMVDAGYFGATKGQELHTFDIDHIGEISLDAAPCFRGAYNAPSPWFFAVPHRWGGIDHPRNFVVLHSSLNRSFGDIFSREKHEYLSQVILKKVAEFYAWVGKARINWANLPEIQTANPAGVAQH